MPKFFKADLTADELRSQFSYDPGTGEFSRLVRKNNKWPVGSAAGGVSKKYGYVVININGSIYKAHRLAWLYMTGEWPVAEVDHIDGNRANNRWCNLRSATCHQNSRNRKPVTGSYSGLKGVSLQDGRWRSTIYLDGKNRHLGYFDNAIDAHQAYVEAAKKHYGEFARWS